MYVCTTGLGDDGDDDDMACCFQRCMLIAAEFVICTGSRGAGLGKAGR